MKVFWVAVPSYGKGTSEPVVDSQVEREVFTHVSDLLNRKVRICRNTSVTPSTRRPDVDNHHHLNMGCQLGGSSL